MRQPTVLAVIPARYGSRRFPGKPLVEIDGLPMVVRVAQRAALAEGVQRVVVATDTERVLHVVEQFGIECVMTPLDCASGTDRVAWVVDSLSAQSSPDVVVNVQGDEPLIDPRDIDVLIRYMQNVDHGIGTLARPIEDEATYKNSNVVKVVVDATGRAIYFSRAAIPSGAEVTKNDSKDKPLQHVGLYAYTPRALMDFVGFSPSPLERLEKLEQLRAIENGIPVYVEQCVSFQPSIAVDTPEDVVAVVKALGRRSNASMDADIENRI